MSVDNSETAEHEWQEWARLLREHRPPHRQDDAFSPLFWPLLQAAYAEPVLRRLYPGMSMYFLGFFENELWGTDPTSWSRPGVFTWESGYTVLTEWGTTNNELLTTRDPVEAARYVANLLAPQSPAT